MKRHALLAALLCMAAGVAGAQSPLDRRISVHVRDVALRDALDRVALLANIRISYSGDNLPLDRRVTISRDTTSLSDVLAELLRTYPVRPVVVAADHVVLSPREASVRDSLGTVAVLDRVVVTGSVVPAPERALPVAIDVIRGKDLEQRDESALSQIFSGSVPGVWIWEQPPTAMLARYGSIRGASSFGLSSPKVYIDGIEVANPLLLSQITPELVDRVEVIRGPQGAALYGADAISGVVNIVSRHEGTRADGTHALLRSSAGLTSSTYTSSAVGAQEHFLTMRGGSNLRSGGVTVGGSTSGEYVPQGYSREFRAMADGRAIGSWTSVSVNARLYGKNAGVPASPLLAALKPEVFHADSVPQKLRMYSLGSTVTATPSPAVTYTLTAGLDGYSLSNVSNVIAPIPALVDTALRDASGSAVRGTMRASAVRTFGAPERVGGSLTVAAEQSVLRDKRLQTPSPSTAGPGPGAALFVTGRTGNTGVTAQANLAVREALYVSAGVRRESIGQTDGSSQGGTLPMLGAALVHDYDLVTVKLRGAYGKGIRTPRSTIRVGTHDAKRTFPNPDLQPEEQSGIEAGADVFFGRRLGVHVTRFDQLASGLIQTVTITDPYGSGSGSGKYPSWFQLQNVGEISNRGWETQASVAIGATTFAGAAAFVDSRVHRIARGYSGDLRPGDRMLGVPSRTLSGTVAWVGAKVQWSSTISRATDWVDYDRLRIAQALIQQGGDARGFTGQNLRPYWATYPGATRLRASASMDVWRGTALSLTGENLLNYQRGEPDTITIVPGRTVMLGVRARF